MIFLFIGLIASGILARVNLISHRGGIFVFDEARKSLLRVCFDLFGAGLGIAAFIFSFALYQWWWPIIAFVVGVWAIPTVAVTRATYAIWYSNQSSLRNIAFACYFVLVGLYFDFI